MGRQKFLVAILIVFGALLLLFFLRFCSPTPQIKTGEEGTSLRPDVAVWIAKNFGDDQKKKTAATRLAEANQLILAQPDLAMEVGKKGSLAMACYFEAFESGFKIDGVPVYQALEELTFNTRARARAYVNYNRQFSGKVLQLHDLKSWKDECEQPLSL